MSYNWQQKDWPEFKYDVTALETLLFQFAERQGHISGLTKGLSDRMQQQSVLDIMVLEAVKNFEIEGEYISREDVLSSIRNKLGINRFPEKIKDRRVAGIARLMVNLRENFSAPLSDSMLFDWHKMIMEPYLNINKGQWRSSIEPMQVVSGTAGNEIIHFEAPPSSNVPQEMKNFIQWFNESAPGQKKAIFYSPVRSAIAHLFFESIHPFEDGNGRIGRALSEKVLSQGLGRPILLSLSNAIELKRKDYYEALKNAQGSNEITSWLKYFLQIILDAQEQTSIQIQFTLRKAHFFDQYKEQLNPRQEKALRKMFDAGPTGFKGGMSAKKYVAINKTSKATATRDLTQLVKMDAMKIVGTGRGTRYELQT